MEDTEYTYQKLCEDVLTLQKRFPFLQVDSIGNSLCGRTLYRLGIGSGRDAVLFAGAFHGMERITSALLMRFFCALAEAVQTNGALQGVPVRQLLAKRHLCLLPSINPDGAEISIFGAYRAGEYAAFVREHANGNLSCWQANARGVDLNHNFGAGWTILRKLEIQEGYCAPGPTRFGGYAPESEPETFSLTQLCRKEPFLYVLAFHTQGEEIYYRYGDQTPPYARKMAKILSETSGYAISEPEGIASMGGFKDWFIQTFQRPGFTIEAGLGKNPLPPSDLPALYQRLEPMLVAALELPIPVSSVS